MNPLGNQFFSKIYAASQWKQELEKAIIVWWEFDTRQGEIESSHAFDSAWFGNNSPIIQF